MKTFIRSYTDIRGLRKGTVYEVACFGNKLLTPYYNKDEKPVPMTSIWSEWVSEKLSGIMSDDTLSHFTPVQL
jgi:hypothetical protein